MRNYLTIAFSILVLIGVSQPANNNCTSAISLTTNAALTCNQQAAGAGVQSGECVVNWTGANNSTMWYSFTASNDSMVLNFILNTSDAPVLTVYGPFSSVAAGCVPNCTQDIYAVQQIGDPGHHILLTNLTTTSGNNTYLVQIDAADPNGPSNATDQFCINVNTPATNSQPSGASLVSSCGTSFANSTNGGYWANGTSTGFNNLDGNGSTTASGASETGDDVTFVVNNASWTYFCAATAGSWQVTVGSISGCQNASPNNGVQAALFTGTPGNLTNIQQSPTNGTTGGNAQLQPGQSWTSNTFSLAAGQCAYLMMDGFAGDACNYGVTLTNVSGGCLVLPIELVSFDALSEKNNLVYLSWITSMEKNNDYFTIERSLDGVNFEKLYSVKGAGNSDDNKKYGLYDHNVPNGFAYYRLKQTDKSGVSTLSAAKSVYVKGNRDFDFTIVPNPSFDGSFSLQFNSSLEENYSIQIMDLSGHLVMQTETNKNNITNVSVQLESGIYFVQINLPEKKLVKKLVIGSNR